VSGRSACFGVLISTDDAGPGAERVKSPVASRMSLVIEGIVRSQSGIAPVQDSWGFIWESLTKARILNKLR